MLHKPHPGVPRPAALVLVAHDVLVVGVGVLREVALHQVPGSKLVTTDLNLGTEKRMNLVCSAVRRRKMWNFSMFLLYSRTGWLTC